MKKYFLKVFPLFAVIGMLCMTTGIPVFASAKSTLSYELQKDANGEVVTDENGDEVREFVLSPENEAYPTDLFTYFKNVVPGFSGTQTITIVNNYDSKSIDVSLKANDVPDDFRKYMTLTVTANGEKTTMSGSTLKLDLGRLGPGESVEVKVKLSVSTDMENDQQNESTASFEWVFQAEESDMMTLTYWKLDPVNGTKENNYWVPITSKEYKKDQWVYGWLGQFLSGEEAGVENFVGWYLDPDNMTDDNAVLQVQMSKNINLYAGTKPAGSAGGDLGGSGGSSNITVTYYCPLDNTTIGTQTFDGTGIKTADNFLTNTHDHSGYEFYGWLTDSDNPDSTLPETYYLGKDMTLYAGFRQVSTEPSEPSNPSEPEVTTTTTTGATPVATTKVLPQTGSSEVKKHSSHSHSDSDSSDDTSGVAAIASILENIIPGATGDDSPITFWSGLFLICLIYLTSTIVGSYRKRRKM